ncbi:MAG: hypothetical protein ACPGSM_13415 [Thiolinea sp.]
MNPSLLHETNPRHEHYRVIGIVVWVSFVAACMATALFFATFDPLDIIDQTTFPLDLDRMDCYSIGFFLFWALTLCTGSAVAWLIKTPVASVSAIKQIKNGDKPS